MLKPDELARLSWHPIRNASKGGRPENYAIGGPDGAWRYGMACGHRSVPRLTVCERGCKTAPAWEQPLTLNTRLQALERFNTRYDPSRLPRSRLRALQARASVLGAERGYRFVPRQVA